MTVIYFDIINHNIINNYTLLPSPLPNITKIFTINNDPMSVTSQTEIIKMSEPKRSMRSKVVSLLSNPIIILGIRALQFIFAIVVIGAIGRCK